MNEGWKQMKEVWGKRMNGRVGLGHKKNVGVAEEERGGDLFKAGNVFLETALELITSQKFIGEV